jgi:salicylate hydroxylase
MVRDEPVVIAGAGIAGLTAALAFAAKGHAVRILERSEKLEEVGAGLQLSPNATRILRRLDVLEVLEPRAVRPDAVILRQASDLRELARVPLGDFAERRWKAPYLVAHRADLQNALMERVLGERSIELTTGANVRKASLSAHSAGVSIEVGGEVAEVQGCLVVGADGVWSTLRPIAGKLGRSRFAGALAWRTTIPSEGTAAKMLLGIGADTAVTAFLHAGAHMIVYPLRGGAAFNLVAFTPGRRIAENWSGEADSISLHNALRGAAAELSQLVELAGPWTIWPVHTVDQAGPWTCAGRLVLIGDAAHAMTPFAAQGAAMAIEDAETLATAVSASAGNLPRTLAEWESARRPRILRVARRGALNRLAWHAGGPAAVARNLFLRLRSPENLAADLDWLYGLGA